MIELKRCLLAAAVLACGCALAPVSVAFGQVPAASVPSAVGTPRVYSSADLETLVGPFALYPDDLVAIILPASTYPLQVVQADRFLDKRKANPQLQIDDGWDDSVKALVNYPDVVKKMSADLDWTEALGEAVVSSNDAVMEAVQVFRRKAQSAGNLKSNEKQVIVVEQQVIRIEPADPTVIYVPQYQPSQVVVVGAPVYPYSVPYPVYHYPYPPGAALATGIIWGAALGAAWNGGRYATHYGGGSINNNITINRGGNTINTGNINTGNINRGGSANTLPANTWKPTKQPGQVGSAGNRPAGPRVGDPRPATGGGSMGGSGFSPRPAQGDVGRGGAQSSSTRPVGGGGSAGGAFGGLDSGAAAHRASARGQESRGGFGGSQGGGGMQAARGGGAHAAAGGGGARMGAAGGGGRAGGGGGRGGGGRGR